MDTLLDDMNIVNNIDKGQFVKEISRQYKDLSIMALAELFLLSALYCLDAERIEL